MLLGFKFYAQIFSFRMNFIIMGDRFVIVFVKDDLIKVLVFEDILSTLLGVVP